MILEENYRKVAEYTQKAFKLYSRRYFANLMLQTLQKKQKVKQFEKLNSEATRNLNITQKESELEIQNFQNEKENEFQQKNKFSTTFNNIKMFQPVDKQNLIIDISFLKYGDLVFLQIYNAGMKPSDRSQRLRVYSQLQTMRYRRLSNLQQDSLTQKRCAFQIVNPSDQNSEIMLSGNSLFCLKSLFCNKYICLIDQIKMSQFFGYEINMSNEISMQCFFSFNGLESGQNRIMSYEPIGLKLGLQFVRAQGLQLSGNSEGSVFYFSKIGISAQDLQPSLVTIKNLSVEKFLGSTEIEMGKLINKKTYSNVTIEDENGIAIRQNQLVFATLDFTKATQSDVSLISSQEESMGNVWILSPVYNGGIQQNDEIIIVHASSGRSLVVKPDKNLKISNNQGQRSYFNLLRHDQSSSQSNIDTLKNQLNNAKQELVGSDFNQNSSQENQYSGWIYQLIYDHSNLTLIKNKEEKDNFHLGIEEVQSLNHSKLEEKKNILFEISPISQKESQLIQQLMEIQLALRESYSFIERVGFLLDERSDSLRFCAEEIKKQNHLILSHNKIINKILSKISYFLQTNHHSWISQKKLQIYIKQLKIFQILICLTKIINLKIGKRRHFSQAQEGNNSHKQKSNTAESKQKSSRTPFELCANYFQQMQVSIFQVIYNLTIGNQTCSATIIQEASFFNKLLIHHPYKIGRILQEAIKNLSLFTTKASNNECNQLLQWAKLIQSLTQENVIVQKTYVDIIAQVVVDPKDRGIVPYQNKCRQLLFNQRNRKKTIPIFGLEEEKPTITFQTSNPNDFLYANPILFEIQSYSSSEVCFLIEDFFSTKFQTTDKAKKNKEYIDYMISIVKLTRNLCKDRNKKLLKVIEDYGLTKNHITSCLNSGKIGEMMKMQYLLLYSSIFVDQDPFLCYDRRQVKCHIWSKIREYNLETKTALIFKQYTDQTSAIEKLREFDSDVIPFLQNHINQSKNMMIHLNNLIKEEFLDKWSIQVQQQLDSFKILIKFLYEAISFGFLNIHQIKKFVFFLIEHYQEICTMFQLSFLSKRTSQINKHLFCQKQNQILNQILRIIEINEKIWRDINCINLLKMFQKSYSERKRPMTGTQLREHCWKLLNKQILINFVNQPDLTLPKNPLHLAKKKTVSKNMFCDETSKLYRQVKGNADFDVQIGKFLLMMIMAHIGMSHMASYSKLIEIIRLRERRSSDIYDTFSQLLIINGKKEESIYRELSGRVTGKILNVIKIFELVSRIKGGEEQGGDDLQDQKRRKQKIVEVNNLISKIRRQIMSVKEQDMSLFRKMQLIISRLDIDTILMELLRYSHKVIYMECVSNLYRFYMELIWENQENKKKLSHSFSLFINNFKIQNCSSLISELYIILSESKKKQHIQSLFNKLNQSYREKDYQTEQSILSTLYKIIKNTKQTQLSTQINSQLTLQIFKNNHHLSLLTLDTNLSSQYINLLSQLSQSNSVKNKIKKLYPKNILTNIIYQQHKYNQKPSLLKLLYHFHLKNNPSLQIHQIEDIITNLLLPEIKHLPSLYQYLTNQNLQKNQIHTNEKNQKLLNPQEIQEAQENTALLKKKLENLILYEKSALQPSEQQNYWNFIYNTEDQNQMSLINFTILILNIQQQKQPQKSSFSKKLHKSTKYLQFIKYLNQLFEFLKEAFNNNSNKYQRKIINKLQEILIMDEQKNDTRQKSNFTNVSESQRQFLRQFFDEISNIIITQNISYSQIIDCANVSNSQLCKRRAGQNIEKMILEEEFINFVQKIGKSIKNIKQFNKIITQQKLSTFFSIYKCDKTRKINVYKFLEKLCEYLESLKNDNIRKLNDASQKQQKFSNIGQRIIKNDSLDFVDSITQNDIIESHFKNYVRSHETMLKILLLEDWIHKNQSLFKLILEDLNKETFKPIKSQQLLEYAKKYTQQTNRTQHGHQNERLQSKKDCNYLVCFYLFKMCYGEMGLGKNSDESFDQENPFPNNLIEVDSRYDKDSITFSRIALLIMKEINNYDNMYIQTTQADLRKNIKMKILSNARGQSQTVNQLLYQLIINFNKSSVQKNLVRLKTKKYQVSHLFQKRNKPNQKAEIIYEQIFRQFKKKVNLISNFNFSYTVQSQLQLDNFYQSHVPSNFTLSVKAIEYGLSNGLVDQKNMRTLQNCFLKIMFVWAMKKADFADLNWLCILKSIINLVDKYIKSINYFAGMLAKSSEYVQRYTQLVQQCCSNGLSTTSVKGTTEIKLFKLLTEFHLKFYLENQKESLGRIFNHLDFQLLIQTVQVTYRQSIQPKLNILESQDWCEIQNQVHSKACTYELCNEGKATQNDHNIMETFVTLLIIIQFSISLKRNKYFLTPLIKGSQQTLETIQKILNSSLSEVGSEQEHNYLYFYKKFIGAVYLRSEEGSSTTLHFKIPYLAKHCSQSVKEDLLYYFERQRENNIEKKLDLFSKFLERELQIRKSQEKIPLLSTILTFKTIVQYFIILVNFVHILLQLFPSLQVDHKIFYPFTVIFIFFKVIFAITAFRKSQNIIECIQAQTKTQIRQKLQVFSNQKVFISIILVLLYLTSFSIPGLSSLITLLETTYLRYVHKMYSLLVRAFFGSVFNLAISLFLIVVFLGVMEWQASQDQTFVDDIVQTFKQFYTFAASNLKMSTQYDYDASKRFPIVFLLYSTLILVFIYWNLLFLINQMKMEKNQNKKFENLCLICNGRKIDFEKEGSSFQDHVKVEHNIWNYLYFLIYLRRKGAKQKQNLKNIESSIKQRIDKKSYGFLNISKHP